MPVTLTPVATAGVGTPVDPKTFQATPTKLFGVEQPAKMTSVSIRQGQCGKIKHIMRNNAGDPVDLSGYADASLYDTRLSVRDGSQPSGGTYVYSTIGTVESPADGLVAADIPTEATNNAGIYFAEFSIEEKSTKCILFTNIFWLTVDWGSGGAPTNNSGGPPTLAEIRLHLRDAPEGNRILDEYEFDPAEVAAAVSRCVDWFNEVEPPLSTRYTTQTFPARYHWLEGIAAELFTTAAHYFRRNRFAYSAGGLTVDSLDKEKEYLQAALYHRERWETWARKAKVRANINDGFMSMGSGYSSLNWRN